MNKYTQAKFLLSAARVKQLPPDTGREIAFAGRSNAGKSSALNCLTGIRKLARTSKTPGRTRLINVFQLENPDERLIDLPGYGYAKVSYAQKEEWQTHLAHYLEARQSLYGIVLLMDCRHPLKSLDINLINFAQASNLYLHILLTKSDKLSKSQGLSTLFQVQKQLKENFIENNKITIQLFSALKKQGLEDLVARLDIWFRRCEEALLRG